MLWTTYWNVQIVRFCVYHIQREKCHHETIFVMFSNNTSSSPKTCFDVRFFVLIFGAYVLLLCHGECIFPATDEKTPTIWWNKRAWRTDYMFASTLIPFFFLFAFAAHRNCLENHLEFFFQSRYHFYSFTGVQFAVSRFSLSLNFFLDVIVQFRCESAKQR